MLSRKLFNGYSFNHICRWYMHKRMAALAQLMYTLSIDIRQPH